MHRRRVVALDEVGHPAAAPQELLQFVVLDAGEHGRVADLVAVQVQDRQHGAVADRVEELVGLPCGRERAGFRFAVAHDARDHEVRIVERGPKGVAERVPKLAAFVDRTGRGGGNMTGDSARERELLEQLLQAGLVLGNVGVDLAPGAFEVDIAHDRRTAVTRTGDVEHVQVVFLDDAIQMDVDEVLARRRAPVPDHQRLDVRQLERLFEQWVVIEIYLPD